MVVKKEEKKTVVQDKKEEIKTEVAKDKETDEVQETKEGLITSGSKNDKINDILEKVEKLTVLELADLVEVLEKKFNVSAAAQFAAPTVIPAQGNAVSKEEEQTEFDVILKEVGANKIKVIKEVRAATGLGLKESKDLVESAPKAVKEKMEKKDAEALKEKLEAVGASVEIK